MVTRLVPDNDTNWGADLRDVIARKNALTDDVTGKVPLTVLGTGTPASTTFLRGDGTWSPTGTAITSNTQTSSYTLALNDAGNVVEMNTASAANLTVPPNSSVAFPVGTVIEALQYGAGQFTVVRGSGVTIKPAAGMSPQSRAQNSALVLRQRATDEWILGGDALPGGAIISGVGTRYSNTGVNGTTTISVTPTAVGSMLVLVTAIVSTTISVSSVSGGGVTTWTRAAGPFTSTAGVTRTMGLWYGRVTTAGAATITITPSASVASTRVDLVAQEFSSTSGTSTTWALDSLQAGALDNVVSTSITFPTFAPIAANRLYIGYAASAGLVSGATAGYTYQEDQNENPLIYNPSVSTSQSPTGTQTSAGSASIAGLFVAT